MVSGSRSIHQFGHSDMTHLVFATGRLLELYMCNRRPLMSASDLEMVIYAMRRVAKALAEGPTLADNEEVLEHGYAAKQHSVHSI